MYLVLFGPPGAGKGTQSSKIAEKFNLSHVSTGELLRNAIKNQTKLGLEAKAFMDKGQLVPDSIVKSLIVEELRRPGKSGALFDGYPRNAAQAETLDELLSGEGTKLDRAVFLEVDKDLLMERMVGRRVCTKCGATFHVSMNPPKKEGVCDVCGGRLEQRSDDRADVIENRINVYEQNTAPLKEYYKKAGKLVNVDGVGKPDEVFRRIASSIK